MTGIAVLQNPAQPKRPLQLDEDGRPVPPSRSVYLGAVDFYRIVRRRWKAVALTMAVVLAFALYILLTSNPVYTSSASLIVRPIGADETSAAPTATSAATAEAENLRISTKVEMLQSRQLLRKVAKSLNLTKDPEFATVDQAPGLIDSLVRLVTPKPVASSLIDEEDTRKAAERERMEKIVDKLLDKVDVARVGHSHLISVTASSHEAAKAGHIANRIIETHIKAQQADQREGDVHRREMLTERVRKLRLIIDKADTAVASYKQTHALFTSRPDETARSERLQLAGQLAQARATAAEAAVRSRFAPVPRPVVARSESLNQLRGREATLVQKLAELSVSYGSGHPEVQNTRAQLDATQSTMRAEEGRAAEEAAMLASNAAAEANRRSAGEAAAASTGAAAISGQLRSLYSRSAQEGMNAVGLRALERDADTAEAQLLAALNDLKQLEGKGESKSSDTQIVSEAPLPLAPSHPQPKRMLGVALGGGLVLGLIFAFTAEAMDSRIRNAEQIQRLLGLPTLALVPELVTRRPVHEIVQDRPRSLYSDAMRNLYIELDVRRPSKDRHVVLVTSPLSKEGKTTIAASLAAAAAAMGKHAIVVDLDLRKPGGDGDQTPEPGLDVVAFLSDQAGVDQVIMPQDQRGRFASIRVQQAALDPSALIASPRLELLIDHLSERFQLIVLNAPPVLPVRDAKTIARAADQTVMVLRWGRTPPEAARLAMELFDGPVTGAVLNAVNFRKHAARNYGDAVAYLPELQDYNVEIEESSIRLGARRLVSMLEWHRGPSRA